MPEVGVRRLFANRAAVATYVVGLPTIALALIAAIRDANEIELPEPSLWALAAVEISLFLLLAGASFTLLLPDHLRAAGLAAFLRSQLVKYNPVGGPAQMVSQMALSPEGGQSGADTVMRSKLTAIAGGLLWAPICALTASTLPSVVRLLLGATIVGVVVAHPGLTRFLLRTASRWIKRISVPEHNATFATHLRSTVVAATALAFSGAAFALFATAGTSEVSVLAAISAYAMAWTVGYVAVPFPGGIGVREATLVFLLPLDLSQVLLAAVLIRVTQVTVELLLATIGAAVIERRSRERSTSQLH